MLFQNLKAIGEELSEICVLYCKYIYIFIYIDFTQPEPIFITIAILVIIHRPVFYLKHGVSVITFCLCLHV
jgi:hypothetical protein